MPVDEPYIPTPFNLMQNLCSSFALSILLRVVGGCWYAEVWRCTLAAIGTKDLKRYKERFRHPWVVMGRISAPRTHDLAWTRRVVQGPKRYVPMVWPNIPNIRAHIQSTIVFVDFCIRVFILCVYIYRKYTSINIHVERETEMKQNTCSSYSTIQRTYCST